MTVTAENYVAQILGDTHRRAAQQKSVEVFMPSNIALIKYWGKRKGPLNLPLVSSLSHALGEYGTTTKITLSDMDSVTLNDESLTVHDPAFLKIQTFIDLFRKNGESYNIETTNNIPTAAGVASSASGFAALTEAIAKLQGWDISLKEKSMLARLGSGSASRSFWKEPVIWYKGERADGMDCFAEPCPHVLPAFCMTVLVLDNTTKMWSSREAMEHSLSTSPAAATWPVEQQRHLDAALAAKDFATLGAVVEDNAVLLHRMLAMSKPAIVFDQIETVTWKSRVRKWREAGIPVYFTQDAGANLKLIFPPEEKDVIEAKLDAEGVDYFTV